MFFELLIEFFQKRDPVTLYVSINELPNPRNWGTMEFALGGKLICSDDVNLVAPSADAVFELMARHWPAIQGSGYLRIKYHNVSEWLQERIEEKLHRACTTDALCLQMQ